MPAQSNWNAYVAYKAQSALNAQASGGSAKILRVTDGSQGGKMTRAVYGSREVRRDMLRTRGRHGARETAGVYPTEVCQGQGEDIIAALMQAAYSAANTAITEATASLTSITTTNNTIVAGGGSWLTAGVRGNEIWRLTNHATAANNSKNLLLTGVTASTITVAGTPLTPNATPDTSFTLTRVGRKITNPAAGALAARTYFTNEEHELDDDGSEIFTDCIWSGMKFGMAKDGIVTCEYSWMGTGAFETKTAGSAPHFTSPTENTATPMAVVDASLYYNGVAVADLVSFDITIGNDAARPPTTPVIAPDVIPGQLGVAMNLTLLRSDLAKVADFAAETSLSINMLAVENEAEPKDFFLINVPYAIIGDVAKSAMSQAGGAMTQTITIPREAIGVDPTGGALDATMFKFQVCTAS